MYFPILKIDIQKSFSCELFGSQFAYDICIGLCEYSVPLGGMFLWMKVKKGT